MTPWSILIVDDSAITRSQIREAFEPKGVRILEAANGKEGFLRARAEPIDLVLSDVHMPVMDGLQMIQELRKLPEYQAVPIFVLTSDAAYTRAAEGRKAGANAWITKPIQMDLLWKAVEKTLFGKKPTATSNALPQPARSNNK